MSAVDELRARVFAAVPDFEGVSRAVEAVKRAEREVSAVPAEEVARELLIDAIVTSGTVPEDPERSLLAARQSHEQMMMRRDFYRLAAVELAQRRSSAVADNMGAMFGVLDAEVVDIARILIELGDVPATAAAAVRADRVEQFKVADQCVERYDCMRTVWLELWRLAGVTGRIDDVLQWLRPETVLRAHPETVARVTEVASRDLDGRPVIDVRCAWPGFISGPIEGAWPVMDEDRLEWLLWAAREGALWAPSPGQVSAARAEIRDVINAAVSRRQDAREPGRVSERALLDPRQLAVAAANSAERQHAEKMRAGID